MHDVLEAALLLPKCNSYLAIQEKLDVRLPQEFSKLTWWGGGGGGGGGRVRTSAL